MKRFIYLIVVFIVAFSCSAQQNNSEIIFEKEVHVPFYLPGIGQCNAFNIEDSIYIFSMEKTSKKVMGIYNLNSELIKTISLKNIPYIDMCKMVNIYNWDSIALALGAPLQCLYLMDSSAKIKSKRFFQQFESLDSNGSVEKMFGCSKRFYNVESENYIIYNNIFTRVSGVTNSDVKKVADNYPLMLNVPVDTSLTISNIGDNMIDSIIVDGQFESGYCQVIGNYVFYFNSKELSVLVFDKRNYQYIKKVFIKTDKIKLKSTRHKLEHTQMLDLDICWNKERDEYYILLDVNDNYKQKGYKSVIQVFDNGFNYKKEIKLPHIESNDQVQSVLSVKDKLIVCIVKILNKKTYETDMYYNVYTINF